jgi:renalase
MSPNIFDVAIIGAGIAGLTCAQTLQQAGRNIVILDKSRGVGGRVATRRIQTTHADHGACYLSPAQDPNLQELTQQMLSQGVLQIWTDTVHEFSPDSGLQPAPTRQSRYVAPAGMSAIAKFLTPNLDLRLNHRVTDLRLNADHWECAIAQEASILAKVIVLTIPAPQAIALVPSSADSRAAEYQEFRAQLTSVDFFPSLSVMAGYSCDRAAEWQQNYPQIRAITLPNDPVVSWLGFDSSKHAPALESTPVDTEPVFVLQSSAAFAALHLDAIDLQPAAAQMLAQAAQHFAPWLETPAWMQIHRWRYAFARSPLSTPYLAAPTAFPLVCGGDWCGGRKIEDAYRSGQAIAQHLLGL